ncbi:MAG: hypothetical protein QOH46_2290 [Solirubrobacteraceae bacterium]|jgi:hypothetical protein|nr:hypothetical protein [Solirubrobacteraceae bacterium]
MADDVVELPALGPWHGWRVWTVRGSRREVEIDRVRLVVRSGHEFAIGRAARVSRPWLLLSREVREPWSSRRGPARHAALGRVVIRRAGDMTALWEDRTA